MNLTGRSFRPSRLALVLAALVAAGCALRDARVQQERLDAACVIEGRVSSAAGAERPLVVVLGQGAPSPGHDPWPIADHFVLDRAGRWAFAVPPGRYRLAAFEDANRDLRYQPGEPYVVGAEEGLSCGAGARLDAGLLEIPARAAGRIGGEIDIAALQARDMEGQARRSLGALTVVGDVASLADARFSQENAEGGLWRPFDFIAASWAGIYLLEPDDPARTPVLFVHGMSGTPAKFDAWIAALDRRRFQPWVYYYPTGVRLSAVADHLAQTVAKLQRRYPHPRIVVVAHSMGGLVARGFIQRHARAGTPGAIPLFITVSTPWMGHRAAEVGVKASPVVLRAWEDMAPGSEYQASLFAAPLPPGTEHHLVFGFNRDATSFGASDDRAVTVASQLRPEAQGEARRVYGFDETHTGVFRNPGVAALIGRLAGSLP